MEPIAYLPEPLGVLEVPRYLSVTRIAASGPCLLRMVAPLAGISQGPIGPRAEFGKLVHHLTDLAATGRLGTDGTPAGITEAFEYLLERARFRLSAANETNRYADLRVAFTNREWEKRRFLAIAGAMGVAKTRRTPQPSTPSRTAEMLSVDSFLNRTMPAASEVPFRSAKLRIRGRLDLIEFQAANDVRISDYKSGNVTNSVGTVSEEVLIQLRLYGLAVIDSAPDKSVSLRVLGPNGEIFIPFGDAERRLAHESLMTLLERLPVGNHLQATQLAVVGPQCKGCEVRPVCPLYREAIRELWKRVDGPVELPLDIAGTVIGVEARENEYVSLKLTDLAGRVVKIHRLLRRHILASSTKHVLWFFDLASIETNAGETLWRHPRNFHEVASSSSERTAWTLRIFAANT
jgi:PD-(D/E)XK nuclease superfamily